MTSINSRRKILTGLLVLTTSKLLGINATAKAQTKATRRKQYRGYVIASPCTKDTACVDVCPVDCIHPKKDERKFESEKQLYIDPVECIDCGACVPACPVSAIFSADELPEKWAASLEANAKFFHRRL